MINILFHSDTSVVSCSLILDYAICNFSTPSSTEDNFTQFTLRQGRAEYVYLICYWHGDIIFNIFHSEQHEHVLQVVQLVCSQSHKSLGLVTGSGLQGFNSEGPSLFLELQLSLQMGIRSCHYDLLGPIIGNIIL